MTYCLKRDNTNLVTIRGVGPYQRQNLMCSNACLLSRVRTVVVKLCRLICEPILGAEDSTLFKKISTINCWTAVDYHQLQTQYGSHT